ncbi:SAV_2336 N-terminal domain-related protein [Streptomyces sp. NPDC091371]|uniref:SAV_2336 N-terminal domain-related protein n=1 Tax=Streptomyces sp. NPDC091371 TaxID=3155303 RepID=UPI00342F7CAF
MPDPAAPGIRELAALLGAAGLDPSAEEIADALWLAGRIRRPSAEGARAPARVPDPEPEAEPAREPEAGPEAEDTAGPPPAEPGPGRPEAEGQVRLYAPGAHRPPPEPEADGAGSPGEAGVPVRVPGAAALPRILDIQRALRALQRHRPPAPPTRRVLDEPATAEASARALGLVIPVLRPESRREATVRLVMDASPSMAVWQDMFEELRTVCERLGAFRDVQVHYLHRLADGAVVLGRGPVAGAGLRSADQLRDPTGRALTIVVSDCAGPMWREGAAQRLLHRWAECTPCVVVQPLPQRLWGRTWLPTERGTLARVEGAGGRLRFRADRPPLPGRPAGGLTVPVLPPSATALGAWARLVAGLGSGPVPAEVGRVLAGHPGAPAPPPRGARPPRELVARFRSSAAPRAVQLSVYLSAAPLTLPVMRLVQRTMLPDSEPSDLAEVLLSGLLRRTGPEYGQWYEFVPGVQDVLLGPLGRDEAALVLKHCSEYVLAHFGRGVRNFPALAVSQLTGAPAPVAEGPVDAAGVPAGRLPRAFAEVSAKVVRRYLPGIPEEGPPAREPAPLPERSRAVRAARARLADGAGDGDARALYEAVAVLRRAVTAPAGPGETPEEAETELAGALLRLWAAQRDPELLAEAERALTGLRTPPARAVRGRVLYERALAGAPDPELLAAADREFAAAGAAAADPQLRRDCAVRRADTLIRLSALREDPAPLHEARAALAPLAGPAPTLAPPPVPAPAPVTGPNPAPDPDGGPASAPAPFTGPGSAPDPVVGPDPARDSVGGPASARDSVGGPASARDPVAGPGSAPDSDGGPASAPAPAGGPGSAPDSVGGPGPDPVTGPGSAPDPVTGSAPDPVTGSAPDPVTGSAPDPVTGPAPDPVTGPDPDPVGGPGSAPDPVGGPGRDPVAGPGSAPAPVAGPGSAPDPDGGPGSDPDPVAGSARGPVAGPGPARGPFAGSGPGPRPVPHPELHLALGRVLLALLPHTPAPADRTTLAEEAAARLAAALRSLLGGTAPNRRRVAGVRVELAGALRYLPGWLGEAAGQLAAALEEADGDPELRVAALVCRARVHRARYARDGDPVALEDAAEAYGRARRLIPRDAEVFAELLPEWGDVLLVRARAADGRRFTGAAVRVLRDSRAAVPQSDPDAAHRLRRLATGLRLRHAYEGDPVDLLEAEHLLELAARQSRSPLDRARALRDHGDVQQEIHAHTRALDRLDRAADSYRRSWRAALEADRAAQPDRTDTSVRLAARVQELRGEVLERLARPRAALDAYRSALELWTRLGSAAGADQERREALRARTRALEADL